MKRYIIVYICTLLVMVPLDFLFLGTVGKKIFYAHVGDMLLDGARMLPAILFYLLFCLGTVIFVNGAAPESWAANARYGALFGFFCYATFELTNMTILKHWEWSVAVPDMVWGAVVTAITAALGGLIANWLLLKL